jgi:predicted HicB family RNase H-like nuclease
MPERTDLHIRDFPPELRARAKATAALREIPLKDWIVEAVEEKIKREVTIK